MAAVGSVDVSVYTQRPGCDLLARHYSSAHTDKRETQRMWSVTACDLPNLHKPWAVSMEKFHLKVT